MSDLLKKLLTRPHASDVVAEFVRHVKNKVDPSVFACAYMELLRSEDADLRQEATWVATFAASRSWPEMREYVLGRVNEDDRDVLQSKDAEAFYGCWLIMVTNQIKDYWRQYMKAKGDERITE